MERSRLASAIGRDRAHLSKSKVPDSNECSRTRWVSELGTQELRLNACGREPFPSQRDRKRPWGTARPTLRFTHVPEGRAAGPSAAVSAKSSPDIGIGIHIIAVTVIQYSPEYFSGGISPKGISTSP